MERKESSCKKVNKNSYQKALLTVVALAFAFAVAVIALVVYVDPFFHYHKPLRPLFAEAFEACEGYQ